MSYMIVVLQKEPKIVHKYLLEVKYIILNLMDGVYLSLQNTSQQTQIT